MCVWGVVLINILMLQLDPPKQKFLTSPLHLPNTSWTLTFLYMQLCMAAEVILQIVTLNLLRFKSKNAPIALTYSFIADRSLNYLSYKFCMTIFFQPIQWSDKSTGFFLNLRSSDIRVKLLKFCLAKTNILYSSNPIYKTTTYWSFIYLLWSNLIIYLFLWGGEILHQIWLKFALRSQDPFVFFDRLLS